ncbi:hypothetical protein PTSG_07571 [Salpingoeca rosetta]|uniref:Major facilitator superfamily (MFS) profile domain-containing protein n=1 Tax=Salpingoeca rosetta (strain ATCC 50818 / BSB-021) TaxID=946362 RepID=F2UH53_SALR5|nr:uncharacterized protein PTSG_07571 [Salpingoeca rosetta]EGD76452.1 hypothetical protein PTSG_07571 [Salpingoeca rosetta]|eukprot:XP_004991367.1 hypothetical protein PTSG_07571 [Salpingoeca rosetta]
MSDLGEGGSAWAKGGMSGSQDDAGGPRYTAWVLVATLVAVIGGTFQFGYNTGVINTPQDVIEQSLSGCNTSVNCNSTITTVQWSTAVSMFAVGGLFGGLGCGPFISMLGLRTTFALNNIILIGAALMMALAPTIKLFTAGRFLVGLGSGVTTSMGIHDALGTVSLWRYLLGFSLLPACLQLATIFLVPESPRWLFLSRGRETDARRHLRRLRGGDESAVEGEMQRMQQEQDAQAAIEVLGVFELLRTRSLWKTLVIGITLQACQQLSGINAIFYYSSSIFKDANVNNGDVATAIAGVVNVVMTVVSVVLIDRLGRRPLLLFGLFGMAASYALLTVSVYTEDKASFMSNISVLSVILVIVCFAVGPGGIPWLMAAELFPAQATTSAMSLCVACNWIFNFVVGISFTPLQKAIGHNVFIPFIVLCSLFGLFVLVFVPETKGKTIDQIQHELNPHTRKVEQTVQVDQ